VRFDEHGRDLGHGAEAASVGEALIRATGGTPVYEGGLENAREY